jgi:hypothetical protein
VRHLASAHVGNDLAIARRQASALLAEGYEAQLGAVHPWALTIRRIGLNALPHLKGWHKEVACPPLEVPWVAAALRVDVPQCQYFVVFSGSSRHLRPPAQVVSAGVPSGAPHKVRESGWWSWGTRAP